MALNDFIATYICKKCGANMIENKGRDNFGMHVYSYFKCSNTECDNETEDADEYMENRMITKIIYK